MFKKHFQNILTSFECYLTNAASEGLNSKIGPAGGVDDIREDPRKLDQRLS